MVMIIDHTSDYYDDETSADDENGNNNVNDKEDNCG